MTLQSSGQISINDVATEFGDTGIIQLSDYYDRHPDLPKSGEIALSDFYGVQNIAVTDVINRNSGVVSSVAGVGFYTRSVAINGSPGGGDVLLRKDLPAAYTVFDQWTDNGEPDDPTVWEIRFTLNSSSTSGPTGNVDVFIDGVAGSFGTWYTLQVSTANFGAAYAGCGALNVGDNGKVNFTAEIREVGQTLILSTSTHDCEAYGWFI